MKKPTKDLIVHLEAGTVGVMGIVSHSYRRAACGAVAERWLTTANTDWPGIENVSCKRCKRTKLYKGKLCGDEFNGDVCHLEVGHHTPHKSETAEWGECPRYTDDSYS